MNPDINKILKEYNIELFRQGDTLMVISPNELPKKALDILDKWSKGEFQSVQAVIGPKPSLFERLSGLVLPVTLLTGDEWLFTKNGRHLTIESKQDLGRLWEIVVRMIEADGYFDTVTQEKEGKVCRRYIRGQTNDEAIPTQDQPTPRIVSPSEPVKVERDGAITQDEILNIKIALETQDVNEFIKNM